MRITVGGVLIFGGVVGAAVYLGAGHFSGLDLSKSGQINALAAKLEKINLPIDSIKNYAPFKKYLGSTSPSPFAQVVESPPAVPSPVPPAPAPVSAVETPPVVEAPVVKPVVQKTAVKTRRRGRRKPKAKAAAPVAKASSKAKAAPAVKAKGPAKSGDALIGSYVAVSLKTGREVKGIYQSKTATSYVIELPGMGPFEYPIENVSGIKPAE